MWVKAGKMFATLHSDPNWLLGPRILTIDLRKVSSYDSRKKQTNRTSLFVAIVVRYLMTKRLCLFFSYRKNPKKE